MCENVTYRVRDVMMGIDVMKICELMSDVNEDVCVRIQFACDLLVSTMRRSGRQYVRIEGGSKADDYVVVVLQSFLIEYGIVLQLPIAYRPYGHRCVLPCIWLLSTHGRRGGDGALIATQTSA